MKKNDVACGNRFSQVIIVGIAKCKVAIDIQPGTSSPEYLSLGNKCKYTRLFITILLVAATNWKQTKGPSMGKWLTEL